MLFADDSLLFCHANAEECQQILAVLDAYAHASGQYVNFQKSAILFGKNVSADVQQSIINMLGITKTGGFGKYLGLPETVGQNKSDAFGFISQRVQQKLQSWYSNFLSLAGKEVLIKSIATALPTYAMSCFMLPKRLLSQITGQIRRFWWSTLKDKQKIPWVAWRKMTTLKQYRGMGFRDLNLFNIALLAKQGWRILKEPQLLLSQVLRAKYFSKSSLMEAKPGYRPSHAWRSILQGMQLIKQGLRWSVGDGNTIKAWHDPWLSNPPRPARCIGSPLNDSLPVSGLMKPTLNDWDDTKLQEQVHPEDIPLIKKMRLRLVKAPDVPTWIFTKDGQYTVKSGYHQLFKPNAESSPDNSHINALWKHIWAFNIPPKIKHFWWRVLQNALPVADNLARRRIRTLSDCIFCGEANESIIHLLFHCRLAKEVWKLSPLQMETGQLAGQNSLHDILLSLLATQNLSKDHLFPFIGWRLWKARNDLLFNNKRWAIPEIIQHALMDYQLWKDSQDVPNTYLQRYNAPKQVPETTLAEVMHHTSSFVCCADASWTDPNSRAGIGWILLTPEGKTVLKGFSSIDPVNSALEAEAIALKESLFHLKHLSYKDVIFCGDLLTLYIFMEKAKQQLNHLPGCLEIQSHLDDIKALSLSSYAFRFIRRSDNNVADFLAKHARCHNSPFTISWNV